MIESSDPYTYPETDVLRNLRNIQDFDTLAQFEAEATTHRIAELIARPVNGPFDVAHLKAIHRHVFQDVYSWAGQFRTINISKGGHLFGAAAFLERSLASLFQRLARENHRKGAASDAFVERAAFYLGEINAAHRFAKAMAMLNANLCVNWASLRAL